MSQACPSSVVRGPLPSSCEGGDGSAAINTSTNHNATDDGPRTTDYLVSHGKSGGVSGFAAAASLTLRRGDRVLVDGPRGREVGTVLRALTRLAGALEVKPSGAIVRLLTATDDAALHEARILEDLLFERSRLLARELAVPVEVLDAEVLWDGRAVIHFVGDSSQLDSLAESLARSLHLEIFLENLALPAEPAAVGGCGKPDCGRTEHGGHGGCSSCGSGGGCSTCGAHAPDLRPYFAHLREKMEVMGGAVRTPLPINES